jgi:hypothetical protein
MTFLSAAGDRSRHWVPSVLLRAVALVDALALPALVGYWVWTWKTPTPGVRALVAFLVGYWALKRAYAATVGFDSFQWRLTRLAVAAAVVWAFTRVMS